MKNIEEIVKDAGFSTRNIPAQLGLSRRAYFDRLDGTRDWKFNELRILAEINQYDPFLVMSREDEQEYIVKIVKK